MALSNRLAVFFVAFLSILSILSVPASAQHWNTKASGWSTIWATAQQLVEPGNLPPPPFNITNAIFANSTLRQTVKVTLGAPQIRLRFSNAFGLDPLTITSVAIALPTNGSAGVEGILKGSSKVVTFNGGNADVTLPKGSLAVSDPVNFSVKKGQVLSITVYLKDGITGGAVTGHPGSRTDSWLVFGNQVGEAGLRGESLTKTAHWYLLAGIEGNLPPSAKYLSILGDSITDGRGSTTNQNNRWTDLLSASLPPNSLIAIGNQGLGGNCILSSCLGPPTLSRINSDILSQPGITHAMIFAGINDIGSAPSTPTAQKLVGDQLINAFKQFITQVQGAGLKAIGATITPFGGSFYDDGTGERERTRGRVNEWIRRGGFDAVADFDRAVRNGTVLKREFDSGDGLHINVEGYAAMVKAFPVRVL